MRLFRRTPTAAPTRAPVIDDPAADAAVAALREGDARPALGLLRIDRGDHEARSHHVNAIGDEFDLLDAFTDLDGLTGLDLADRLLALGWARIIEAWAIRGDGRSQTVGRDRFAIFHPTLAESIPLLQHAAAHAPDDPTPWVALQSAGMGLQVGENDRDALFREAIARSPRHFQAHDTRLQTLCKKWGGDNDVMVEFARGVADCAPGDPLAAMLPMALMEASYDNGLEAVNARMRAEHTELATAADRYSAVDTTHPRRYLAHNQFAFAFSLAGDTTRAQRHLDALGARVSRTPWTYFGDRDEVFARITDSVR